MKELQLTKKSHPAIFKSCKNFGQIIQWVEKEGSKDGLYVSKIRLNGRLVDEDEENLLERLAVQAVSYTHLTLPTTPYV